MARRTVAGCCCLSSPQLLFYWLFFYCCAFSAFLRPQQQQLPSELCFVHRDVDDDDDNWPHKLFKLQLIMWLHKESSSSATFVEFFCGVELPAATDLN